VRPVKTIALFLLALALPVTAAASLAVATNAGRPGLRIDARGNAEVSWTASGAKRTLLVPPTGRAEPGRALASPDVSRPAAASIPFARAVRQTPDGRLWALQAWQVVPGGPVELRFARWRGAPTRITLSLGGGSTLAGRASFGGRPVAGYARSFEGKRLRIYVYVDAFVGGRWKRIGGVAPRADGTFRRVVPAAFASATRFRATVQGPTAGATIAPDASAVVAA
jgi:hypothetical protein